VFDRAPAIGFPEHRSEPCVGAVEPVARHLHGTYGEAGAARDDDRGPLPGMLGPHPRVLSRPVNTGGVCGEFGARRGEADMLDIEADQRGTAQTAGGQQQQGTASQAGDIARAAAWPYGSVRSAWPAAAAVARRPSAPAPLR